MVFTLTCSLLSCSRKSYPVDKSTYAFTTITGIPDYSDLKYWAAHPSKYDPSDSVPAALKYNYRQDTLADVFFIHPTTLTDYSDTSWNATINDAAINIKTDNSTILYQASVFNESCRVFAPRYRQAHIRAFYTSKETAQKYFDIAYADIKAAFEFYLEHYNNGRPIIIASHSQGTLHAGRLLKEFFEGKPLQNKLVCAYVIGLPIPSDYFTQIHPCSDSLATGCFVGWRTFKSGYEPEFVQQEKFKSIVINPLTWTSNEDYVPAYYNKGGVLQNFNKITDHVVSAQVHNNVLWTSKPDVFGKILLTNKNYHIGDINLFYMNIRENVRTRITSYFKKL
ncbi:MAG: DUF3089 domain-containing protein [Ferruginibacter sp.]